MKESYLNSKWSGLVKALEEASSKEGGDEDVPYLPLVECVLEPYEKGLLVKVFYDSAPLQLEHYNRVSKVSSRRLDNILIDVLVNKGEWKDEVEAWFLKSDNTIEEFLSIAAEYELFWDFSVKKAIKYSYLMAFPLIKVRWEEKKAVLSLNWRVAKERFSGIFPIFGFIKKWILIKNTIYCVKDEYVGVLESFGNKLESADISLNKLNPIFSLIPLNGVQLKDKEAVFQEENPDKRPKVKRLSPFPFLYLTEKEGSGVPTPILEGEVIFKYESPKEKERVVYLPDIEKEKELILS
ncbi:MAG: hypothetical protein D6780_01100, partial [Candidatus Dadabacteria bacterium]